MWFVSAIQKRFNLEKKEETFSSIREDQSRRNVTLKISTTKLHRAGKLMRTETDRLFLSTGQVFLI